MAAAKQLGMVRVWKDGEQWRYVPAGQWAPDNAELGKRLLVDGVEVIYVERGRSGEFIRGAVSGQHK